METFKERAEIISNITAETAAMCMRSIGVAEAKLRAAAGPGRLVEALKLSVLTLDATPIEVRQWKRKLVTYLRQSGVSQLEGRLGSAQCVLRMHGVRRGGQGHAPQQVRRQGGCATGQTRARRQLPEADHVHLAPAAV